MNNSFRPQIQNGPVAKRTQANYSVKPAAKPITRAAAPLLTQLTPAWSLPTVEVGTLKHRGLSLLALDEQLQLPTQAKEVAKATSRPYALVGLLFCGVLFAGGFMYSLREHFIAHAFGRDEIKLKDQTQNIKAKNQRLQAEVEHAASPQEIDREARKSADLAPLEMDQKKLVSSTKKVTATEKAKIQSAPQPRAKTARH
ncbi:MAG: hypothetical protein U0Y68_10555 [Blastocatellia bacterium]